MPSDTPPLRLVAVLNHRVVADRTYDQQRVVIGRDASCDLQLDNMALSRHHAELLQGAWGWLLRDLGSRNGLLVNGQRVDQHRVLDGDRVQIGKFTVTCQVDQEGSSISHAGDPSQVSQGRTVPLEEDDDDAPAAPEAHLLMTGDGSRRRISLLRDVVSVGSHASCALQLQGWGQPRRLASIVRGATGYTLLNLSPQPEAVFHNGRPVELRVPLAAGDRLEFGTHRARFMSGRA